MNEYKMTIEQVAFDFCNDENEWGFEYHKTIKTIENVLPCYLFNIMLEMRYFDTDLNKSIDIQDDLRWIDDNNEADGWQFTIYCDERKEGTYWFDRWSRKLENVE